MEIQASWPKDGWYSLTIRATSIESELVVAPRREVPAFLQSIITQIENPQSEAVAQQTTSSSAGQEAPNRIYFRLPGSRLREGSIPTYVFKNGTSNLRPKLDYRYELELGGQPFAFVVRNGLRGKSGASYGGGAQYTVEYDGNAYEYSLGEFGWDSMITAIADLDGDGKPDFVISVAGNNSGYEAILLSSKAKPGKNPATASLYASGC
jgi:hypothetical protein